MHTELGAEYPQGYSSLQSSIHTRESAPCTKTNQRPTSRAKTTTARTKYAETIQRSAETSCARMNVTPSGYLHEENTAPVSVAFVVPRAKGPLKRLRRDFHFSFFLDRVQVLWSRVWMKTN